MKQRIRPFALFTIAALCLMAGAVFWALKPAESTVTAYPNPFDSPQLFMEGLYAADHKITPPTAHRIRAVVVPHHLVASEAIASGIRMLRGHTFSKILLLSPDHFHACPTLLCTTNGRFKTLFGEVTSSQADLQKLLVSPLVENTPDLFKKEHGITAILPFIRHDFPEATIIPVALSTDQPWKKNRNELLSTLDRLMDDQTVLVVSSDFSHYLPLKTADEMDEKTAETILSKDLDGISNLKNPDQSDCPGCLWLLGSLADRGGFYNPSVLLHTNSARLLGDEKNPSTTSHFAMAWYANDILGSDDLALGGDVTLTRPSVSTTLPKTISDWWAGSGLRILNLEGPLAKTCPARANPWLFCNPLDLWEKVKDLATHWGTQNNHMLDNGTPGLPETARLIRASGKIPLTTTLWENETTLLLATTEIINPVSDAGNANLSKTKTSLLQTLQNDKTDKLKVVYLHKGEEYQALTSPDTEARYEQWIDAGADAVVVTHSHVPGDLTFYKDKPILRGLGNFIFDQTDSIATQTTKMVRLRKSGGSIQFETLIQPTRL